MPDSFNIYSLKARLLSTIFRNAWFPTIPEGYEIDHKFSLKRGWLLGVDLETISNRNNLQLMTKQRNRQKGIKCSITLDQLRATKATDAKHKQFVQLVDSISDPSLLKGMASFAHAKNQESSEWKMSKEQIEHLITTQAAKHAEALGITTPEFLAGLIRAWGQFKDETEKDNGKH